MVAYCSSTRRIAFGGKNGVIIVHELRASKAQVVFFSINAFLNYIYCK